MIPRQPSVEAAGSVIGDAADDVAEVGLGVEAVQFGSADQAVGSGALAASGGAEEELVVESEGGDAQRVFGGAVVNFQAAVVAIAA